MRLSSISSSSGMISLFGFDQLLPLAKNTGLTVSDPHDAFYLESIVLSLMTAYSPQLSGVVLSPEIGYQAILNKAEGTGVVFCLERRLIEPDPFTIPLLMQHWNVETIRHNYGLAKLELFYNPNEPEASTKKQMVAEIYDYCQYQGIDLVLELLIYIEGTENEYKATFQQLQLEAVREFRTLCSLIALEFPLDALGAVTVTAELDVPWILTGRDTLYDTFKENLRTALDSGAKGFLATEQFLPPFTPKGKFNWDEYQRFITTVGKDRVIELTRITNQSSTVA